MKTVDKGVRVDQDLTGKTHRIWIKRRSEQIFSVTAGKKRLCNCQQEMDLDAVVNPNKIIKVANSEAILKAIKEKKIAAMFGVEGVT
jgi:membrane dipeptidase